MAVFTPRTGTCVIGSIPTDATQPLFVWSRVQKAPKGRGRYLVGDIPDTDDTQPLFVWSRVQKAPKTRVNCILGYLFDLRPDAAVTQASSQFWG